MKKYIVILSLVSLMALAGCSPGLHLNFNATNNLNPDINHHPSPVVVYLYTLKQKELFNLANFQTLVNTPKTLSNSIVKSYTFEVYPGQAKELSLPLSKTSNYIGIFAAYRNLPANNWKKVIDISHHPSSVTLTIKLDNNIITVRK